MGKLKKRTRGFVPVDKLGVSPIEPVIKTEGKKKLDLGCEG